MQQDCSKRCPDKALSGAQQCLKLLFRHETNGRAAGFALHGTSHHHRSAHSDADQRRARLQHTSIHADISSGPPHLYSSVSNLLCIRQAHVGAAVANLACPTQHHPFPATQVQHKNATHSPCVKPCMHRLRSQYVACLRHIACAACSLIPNMPETHQHIVKQAKQQAGRQASPVGDDVRGLIRKVGKHTLVHPGGLDTHDLASYGVGVLVRQQCLRPKARTVEHDIPALSC